MKISIISTCTKFTSAVSTNRFYFWRETLKSSIEFQFKIWKWFWMEIRGEYFQNFLMFSLTKLWFQVWKGEFLWIVRCAWTEFNTLDVSFSDFPLFDFNSLWNKSSPCCHLNLTLCSFQMKVDMDYTLASKLISYTRSISHFIWIDKHHVIKFISLQSMKNWSISWR